VERWLRAKKKRLDFGGNPDLDPDQEIFRRNFTTAVFAMATAPRRGFVRQQFENIRRLADRQIERIKGCHSRGLRSPCASILGIIAIASSSGVSGNSDRLTWQTDVVNFEVVVQLDVARSPVAESRFDDIQRAPAPARAAAVQHVQDVHVAADVAEVGPHAASDLHPAVDRSPDDEHLAGPAALRLEPSVVAVLARRQRLVRRRRRHARREGH